MELLQDGFRVSFAGDGSGDDAFFYEVEVLDSPDSNQPEVFRAVGVFGEGTTQETGILEVYPGGRFVFDGTMDALEFVEHVNRMVPDAELVIGDQEPLAGWLGCAFGALGAGATCAAGTLCTGATATACAGIAAVACFAAAGAATCNCTGECKEV